MGSMGPIPLEVEVPRLPPREAALLLLVGPDLLQLVLLTLVVNASQLAWDSLELQWSSPR
jgi:hypothetical protein